MVWQPICLYNEMVRKLSWQQSFDQNVNFFLILLLPLLLLYIARSYITIYWYLIYTCIDIVVGILFESFGWCDQETWLI